MDKLTIKTDNIVLKLNTGSIVVSGGAVQSVNGKTGAVTLDANDVGAEPLGSVANLKTYVDEQDALKANITYVDSEVGALQAAIDLKADNEHVDQQDQLLQDQIDLKANAQAVNQALSTKADLDESGKVPASQLPSYVDDVLDGRYVNPSQFNDLNGNPYTPETGKIYVDVDTNKTYRWSGMLYVVVGGGGVALGETSSTAYRGDRGKIAYDHSQSQGNPHNSTTSDIPEGLRFYFTDARARSTALTGLNIVNSPILANDSTLTAHGKAQGQIDALKANWVNIDTLAGITWHVNVDRANSKLEVAKIDKHLYIRGYIKTMNANISSGQSIALWNQSDCLLDVSEVGLPASYTTVAASTPLFIGGGTSATFLRYTQSNEGFNGLYLNVNISIVANSQFLVPRTCIGKTF